MGERGGSSPERAEIDRVARILIAEWERVEGLPVNVSYLATFADMARAVIADRAAQTASTERVRAVVLPALQRAAAIARLGSWGCLEETVEQIADRVAAQLTSNPAGAS